MAKRISVKDAEAKIILNAGIPNMKNPYDTLTPEERQKRIVKLYAKIYLRMVEKREEQRKMFGFKE
jgi:pyruvate-formate lyase-activating enzyme